MKKTLNCRDRALDSSNQIKLHFCHSLIYYSDTMKVQIISPFHLYILTIFLVCIVHIDLFLPPLLLTTSQ